MKTHATYVVVMCLLLAGTANGQTIVGGLISNDTEWTAANSPYLVGANISIINNATLTVRPGVEVRFVPGAQLRVSEGTLASLGSQGAPIVFTSQQAGDAGRWNGIHFDGNSIDASFDVGGNYLSGCVLDHTFVDHTTGLASGAGIHMYDTTPYLKDTTVQDCTGSGISISGADGLKMFKVRVRNHSDRGVSLSSSDNVTMTECEITDNGEDGIRVNNSGNVTMTDCEIINNEEKGIYLGPSTDKFIVSADSAHPTSIWGNGQYNLYNSMDFGGFSLGDPGTVDARNVWWGTTNVIEVIDGIYDYLDQSNRGIVFYDPIAVPEPATLSLLVMGGLALIRRRGK